MKDSATLQQAQIFKTLAHPVRLAILTLLRDGEACVCHLEAKLGQRQAYVSQQLAVLRKAGLIEDRRDGLNIFYRLTRPEVLHLLETARQMTGTDEPAYPDAVQCPCPHCTSSLPSVIELVEV